MLENRTSTQRFIKLITRRYGPQYCLCVSGLQRRTFNAMKPSTDLKNGRLAVVQMDRVATLYNYQLHEI